MFSSLTEIPRNVNCTRFQTTKEELNDWKSLRLLTLEIYTVVKKEKKLSADKFTYRYLENVKNLLNITACKTSQRFSHFASKIICLHLVPHEPSFSTITIGISVFLTRGQRIKYRPVLSILGPRVSFTILLIYLFVCHCTFEPPTIHCPAELCDPETFRSRQTLEVRRLD